MLEKELTRTATRKKRRILFKLPLPVVVVTNERPDIELTDEKTGDCELSELTSCADSMENIKNAQSRKFVRYVPLVGDIKSTGVGAKVAPFDVCSLLMHDRLLDTWSERKLLAKR